jgi:DNA-binding transcriptional regulator GbsR (MarR family)
LFIVERTILPDKMGNGNRKDLTRQLISLFSVKTDIALNSVIEKLVLHWGEMASQWGISRMVAQIHALLYFSSRPLPADEIAAALDVARSHVSNSLRELQSWGVVKKVHVIGDRREHFQSIKDVWQLFEILLDERKRREIDPTLKVLREAQALVKDGAATDPLTQERLKEILDFFELMDKWFGEIRRLPLSSRVKLVKVGAKISGWLE